jgi:hypothetical protein
MVNVRKIGAIVTGALFVGATIGMAAAVTVPTTFKSSMLASAGQAKAQLVVGANAPGKVADTDSAQKIQTAVKEKLGGAVGGDIQITYGDEDLNQDGTKPDTFVNFANKAGSSGLDLIDNGDEIKVSSGTEGDIAWLNGALEFDANADGDLKDTDDYTLYNFIYVAGAGEIKLGYEPEMDSDYSMNITDPDCTACEGKKGAVMKIRGNRYAVTDITSDTEVSMGPAIRRSLTAFSGNVNPLDYASTVSGDLKVAVSSDGILYLYDSSGLAQTINVSTCDATTGNACDITDDITADAYKAYKIFVKDQGTKLVFVEKSQISDFSNTQSDVLGYATLYMDLDSQNSDFSAPGAPSVNHSGIYLVSDSISLVKGDAIDLPDTYYRLDYDDNRYLDIQRKVDISVASGSKLKTSVSDYDKFLNQTITVKAIGGVAAEGPTLDIVDEETADKTMNLVLIGGPVANTLTAELVTAGKSTVDWYTSDGDIEVISGAFTTGKYAIIVAGKNREATKAAADALAAAL